LQFYPPPAQNNNSRLAIIKIMSLEETKHETGAIKLRVSGENVERSEQQQAPPRQFVSFTFYKVRPEWRLLDDAAKRAGKAEFLEIYNSYERQLILNSYSLVGLRRTADLMIWRVGYDLDKFQEMTARLNNTGLGRYLDVSENFLSMTKRSLYIDKYNPEHDEDRLHVIPGKSKYVFVYPFVKTRDWYMADAETRQTLMDEHIRVGMKYKSVKINTTYSYGLDDQEFVVAFETDSPQDFLDLVEDLRFTKASKFTLRDTPMYTCRLLELRECLEALG
jgi:chlorite dismutase